MQRSCARSHSCCRSSDFHLGLSHLQIWAAPLSPEVPPCPRREGRKRSGGKGRGTRPAQRPDWSGFGFSASSFLLPLLCLASCSLRVPHAALSRGNPPCRFRGRRSQTGPPNLDSSLDPCLADSLSGHSFLVQLLSSNKSLSVRTLMAAER